jgi:hypothetical protein
VKRRTIFGYPVEWYWHRFMGMPVKFPFCTSVWTGLYGLQFGDVFLGIVVGKVTEYKGKPISAGEALRRGTA